MTEAAEERFAPVLQEVARALAATLRNPSGPRSRR